MAESGFSLQSMEFERWPCTILTENITTPDGNYNGGTLFAIATTYTNQLQIQQETEILGKCLDTGDSYGLDVTVPGSKLRLIDQETRELLRNVSKPERRLMILNDEAWIAEGKCLRLSDQVILNNVNQDLPPDAVGIIAYKGPCNRKRGTFFGVKLDEQYKGMGTSDGMFMKVRHFHCDDDDAVFVSLFQVRQNKDTGIPSRTSSLSTFHGIKEPPSDVHLSLGNSSFSSAAFNGSNHQPNYLQLQGPFDGSAENSILNRIDEAVAATESQPLPSLPSLHPPPPPPTQNLDGFLRLDSHPGHRPSGHPRHQRRDSSSNSGSGNGSNAAIGSVNLQGPGEGNSQEIPLKVGDRVVWVSDEGPHKGVVRWIGQPGELDPAERQVTVGVELDERKGTGTGRYKGRDIFRAPKGHAAFMPIIGLMKAEDYGAPDAAAASGGERLNSEDDPDIKRAIEESLKEAQRSSHSGSSSSARRMTEHSDDSFPVALPPLNLDPNQPESYIGEGVRRKTPNRPTGPPSIPSVPSSLPVRPTGPPSNSSIPPSLPVRPTGPPSNSSNPSPVPVRPTGPASNSSNSSSSFSQPGSFGELTIGSSVEVLKKRYGIIKWIGKLKNAPDPNKDMAGILMEDENETLYTAGVFKGEQVFEAPPHRALFIYLQNCKPDKRHQNRPMKPLMPQQQQQIPQPPMPQQQIPEPQMQLSLQESPQQQRMSVKPKTARSFTRSTSQETSMPASLESMVSVPDAALSLVQYVGRAKGIEGIENLTGFISLLYCWFQFMDTLDSALGRDVILADVESIQEVKIILRNEVVKPLRISGKVYTDKIQKLHSVLMNFMKANISEATPEHYITLVLSDILKYPKFISLSSESAGLDYLVINPLPSRFIHKIPIPNTQQILEMEMCTKKAKFLAVPKVLHMVCKLNQLQPLLEINVEGLVEGTQQMCFVCGGPDAVIQCFDCYSSDYEDSLAATYFCENCSGMKHKNKKNVDHQLVKMCPTQTNGNDCKLQLSAVICEVNQRFVAYVKCGKGLVCQWVLFNCTASTIQTNNTKKFISQVSLCAADITEWMQPTFNPKISDVMKQKQDLRNLVSNTHMCIYIKE